MTTLTAFSSSSWETSRDGWADGWNSIEHSKEWDRVRYHHFFTYFTFSLCMVSDILTDGFSHTQYVKLNWRVNVVDLLDARCSCVRRARRTVLPRCGPTWTCWRSICCPATKKRKPTEYRKRSNGNSSCVFPRRRFECDWLLRPQPHPHPRPLSLLLSLSLLPAPSRRPQSSRARLAAGRPTRRTARPLQQHAPTLTHSPTHSYSASCTVTPVKKSPTIEPN